MEDKDAREFSWEFYGALKARCENRAREEIGADRLTILRPTYICGPGDHTDRFTYWPVRTSKGGEMLWPGSLSHPIQIIDVRDLANFVVDCLEQEISGIYNTVSPVGSYTMGNLLADSQAVTATNVDAVWVDDAFIDSSGASDALPIWHPQSGEFAQASSVSGERARAAGLSNRPIRETIRDLMTWWDTLPPERIAEARFGMTAEREAAATKVCDGRDSIVADLKRELMEKYEKLFAARDGLAVCAIEGANCMGCYTSIPPNLQVKLQVGSAVVQCASCQRILYFPE